MAETAKPEVTQSSSCAHDLTDEPLDATEAHADFNADPETHGFTADETEVEDDA